MQPPAPEAIGGCRQAAAGRCLSNGGASTLPFDACHETGPWPSRNSEHPMGRAPISTAAMTAAETPPRRSPLSTLSIYHRTQGGSALVCSCSEPPRQDRGPGRVQTDRDQRSVTGASHEKHRSISRRLHGQHLHRLGHLANWPNDPSQLFSGSRRLRLALHRHDLFANNAAVSSKLREAADLWKGSDEYRRSLAARAARLIRVVLFRHVHDPMRRSTHQHCGRSKRAQVTANRVACAHPP
jgi:hypothetical protein